MDGGQNTGLTSPVERVKSNDPKLESHGGLVVLQAEAFQFLVTLRQIPTGPSTVRVSLSEDFAISLKL